MECLNCGKEFTTSDNYCSACGQNTSTARMSTEHAVHQFFHAFTHTDKGFFDLIPQLLTKPGIVARDYNEGKRKTYFSPFTFLLLIVAVSTILVAYNNFMSMPTGDGQPYQVKLVTNFLDKHFNVVVLFGIPLMAYFTSLFFRKRINFAEGLVLISYVSGERSLFFAFVVLPLGVIFKDYWYLIVYSYLAIFMLYLSWACSQYLNDYTLKTRLKGALIFVVSQCIISLMISIAVFISYKINPS
ncbi:DUF3667 domain-containing protein [Daejeonella lutea]|uniref:DUF3667 domain-containing protein n=1 Tax=Daejeonella lutea TaxID=572036 RepID=A0A1T5F5L9_9SPHI|nr:DUF3667 domain-containing protein [Daejeonella lutea]SKB91474.1 Protein of unknown function [Daejeonella lutea]